jgi:hypothetical protein
VSEQGQPKRSPRGTFPVQSKAVLPCIQGSVTLYQVGITNHILSISKGSQSGDGHLLKPADFAEELNGGNVDWNDFDLNGSSIHPIAFVANPFC